MSAPLVNRMLKAVTRQSCGATMKGIRHEYRSAKIEKPYADMAPIAYGGMVKS
jgi:hypothetical protein